MRKVIWCCAVAGVLSASSFLSLAYYACRYPDSLVGRSMQAVAEASLVTQPVSGLTALVLHGSQANGSTAGDVEECIPEDPQPVAPERKEEVVIQTCIEIEEEVAPIVLGKEEPMPRDEPAPVVVDPIEDKAAQGCLVAMPYCQDDEDKAPVMPGADGEEAEKEAFKEWMKFLNTNKEEKSLTSEELPAPKEIEETQAEPKCQEDSHLHEQYPGCPRVSSPYRGKSSPVRKSGKEEASEEPPQEIKKSSPGKVGKGKSEELPMPNVDTMEYRKSDGGLNEYGPGPL